MTRNIIFICSDARQSEALKRQHENRIHRFVDAEFIVLEMKM